MRPWASFLRGKGIFVRRIRFVGPRVKISLYVRKCLRPGDILGDENGEVRSTVSRRKEGNYE